MVVEETQQLPLERLAHVAERLAAGAPLSEALELIAGAAAEATGAHLAVVRVLDEASGDLVARAIAPAGSPLAAELSGSRVAPGYEVSADRMLLPARAGGRVVGAIELLGDLEPGVRSAAELVAAELALALRLHHGGATESRLVSLRRAGESLAAGGEFRRAARHIVRDVAEATGARQVVIWKWVDETLDVVASLGPWEDGLLEQARKTAAETRGGWQPLLVDTDPVDRSCIVSIRVGEPVFGVLQLRYAEQPEQSELDALAEYAARAAHALRLGAKAQETQLELEQTRALLSVVGEAISRLSLTHTLETAVERIAALLSIDRVGIYLHDERRLMTAAGRDLDTGHEDIAYALLELATGPLRARDAIEVRSGSRDPALRPVGRVLSAASVESALGVPLRAHDETIGLLVAYPGSHRLTQAEIVLLAALAAQLAVAVQNARLHEQAKELGEALGAVLESERHAARRLAALYEISNTFTRSLSLERTLEALTATIVEVLGVDAAVIRVPDERGGALVPAAVHVADSRLADAVGTILQRPQPQTHLTQPLLLDEASARRLGGANALLLPFLEKGSTAAVIPIATQVELLAHLTILSLDPATPISAETVSTAVTIAAQAALALDNARLYQQQKAFAETIQRALLPGERPTIAGLEVGAVYESAARLDVGGDVYDFVELGNDRIAIVLGDVTGHGVDATADMAMAKFVFRSLAREHPEPGEFLAYANEVIAGEIAVGKFITMVYLALDSSGRFACASAGHPVPRLLQPDGVVEPLTCGGLALGIDAGQEYEQVGGELAGGASIVLYTDGVVEARSGGELYGVERLDRCLADRVGLPAQALAAAVLADCRVFAGGELGDDCAVVVARKA